MDVDLEELAAIIEQLDKTEFTDFLYEKGALRIHVRRGGLLPETELRANGAAAQATAPPNGHAGQPHPAAEHAVAGAAPAPTASAAAPTAAPPAATAAPAPSAPAAASAAAPAPLSADALPPGHVLVKAPMLGTFYRAPKPGEPVFAEVGERVEADAVLCIIEVMKLMNSVPAGIAGEIVAVYAQDGDLVEFDQPLFAVRQAS
jgi:acetyl-CoA carboxylase biotin carboxyl carrier protein